MTGHRRAAEEVATSADVTLRQLRYFAVLGEELNYRRAAEKLFISQPALSTAIKQLEHQFGVPLFTRNTLIRSRFGRADLDLRHRLRAF